MTTELKALTISPLLCPTETLVLSLSHDRGARWKPRGNVDFEDWIYRIMMTACLAGTVACFFWIYS